MTELMARLTLDRDLLITRREKAWKEYLLTDEQVTRVEGYLQLVREFEDKYHLNGSQTNERIETNA